MVAEIIFILIIATIIVSVYFESKKRVIIRHKQKCKLLKKEIELAKFQMSFRNEALKKYNFQSYNLNESLWVQPEIKLN